MDKRFKQFNATIEPVSERKMAFTISTASVDRDGDTIDPKGWDLGSYTKNPVVLWAHDYAQPPVGKAVNIQATKDGLKADVEFLPQGMSPFADMIHDMVKGGFLNATSVGFRGMEYDEAKDRKGYDFKKQELLEFSIVPVPSNPEALALRGVTAEQCQLYAKGMRLWAKSVLGDDAPKMDQSQFDNLADAIAKAMPKHKDEQTDEKKDDKPSAAPLDYAAIAVEVAKILKGLPTANAGESQDEFISRCMGDERMMQEFPDQKQRLAVCFSQHGKAAGEISKNVLDLTPVEPEILWDQIDVPEKGVEVSPEQVAKLLMDSMKDTLREMAGAQARAAINRMTGRLD